VRRRARRTQNLARLGLLSGVHPMPVAQNEKDRGFKGLVGLVSELNLARITQSLEAPSHSQGESTSPSAAPQANPPQRIASPRSRNRDYGRWPQAALIIGGVMVVAVLVINSNDNKPSSGDTAPPYSTNTGVSTTPSRAEHAASPVESIPSIGTDRTLTGSELTYCVAQNARIAAVQPQVNRHSDREIKGFNELIADFNSRCGHFQYYENEMSQVRALVEGEHDEIAKQTQSWLVNWRKGRGSTARGLPSANGKPGAVSYSQYNPEDSTAKADSSEDEDEPKEEDP
jgi:hypothetical protein